MTQHLLLFIGGLAAGFINTLASSGSAVSLPIFLFLGFAPHVANATNRLNVLAAAVASPMVCARQGQIDWGHVPHLLADWLPDRALRGVILLAVGMSLILVLAGTKRFLQAPTREHLTFGWPQMGLLLLAGIWAGLIVLDSYTYLRLILVLAVGYDLVGANAMKVIAGIGVTGAATALFADQAEVDGLAGGLMSLGAAGGARALQGLGVPPARPHHRGRDRAHGLEGGCVGGSTFAPHAPGASLRTWRRAALAAPRRNDRPRPYPLVSPAVVSMLIIRLEPRIRHRYWFITPMRTHQRNLSHEEGSGPCDVNIDAKPSALMLQRRCRRSRMRFPSGSSWMRADHAHRSTRVCPTERRESRPGG